MKKRSEEIKELIVAKARELMKTKHNITIRDIAKASYVNIAAVNYYFGDKDSLISIVINDTIMKLKDELYEAIEKIEKEDSTEKVLTLMIDIIYRFALNNVGIISYLFFNTGQNITSNLLLKEFLLDNEFTNYIINKLKESNPNLDHNTLYAKYTLLFSSFCIPLFIEIMQSLSQEDSSNYILSFKNEHFKNTYIKELIKVINQ